MPDTIYIPVTWELDAIPDACAKLVTLTGHDFGAEMLAATHSGELPANGCCGWADGDAGNLEIARKLGNEATVLWDHVAEWLRAKGYDVRRGKWIEFGEALAQLQARIRPAPTAAELECWTVQGNLYAYIDRRGRFMLAWYNPETWLEYPLPADERRGRLWLDSAQVEAFEPPDRWLNLTQLARRWGCEETTASNRLRPVELHHLAYLNGDEPPAPVHIVGQPEAALVALTAVRALEAEFPQWLRLDEFSAEHQHSPWLNLREREQFDAQRLQERMLTDAAGEYARLRAAAAVGGRLSCWLEPKQIADLYGDALVATLVERAVFDAKTLPARAVCRGIAIYVDDWLHWPGRPQTPAGEAGERVEAWFSLASRCDDQTDADRYEAFILLNWERIFELRRKRDWLIGQSPASITEESQQQVRLREVAAELERREAFANWNDLPEGFDPDRPLDYVPVVPPASVKTAGAEPMPELAPVAALPVSLPGKPCGKSKRSTWTTVLGRQIQSALNEFERRSRGDADVYQFVRNFLEHDARFDWKTTEYGDVWIYPLETGGLKEIMDSSLRKNIRRELKRRRDAKQSNKDTVRTDGQCGAECPAVS